MPQALAHVRAQVEDERDANRALEATDDPAEVADKHMRQNLLEEVDTLIKEFNDGKTAVCPRAVTLCDLF